MSDTSQQIQETVREAYRQKQPLLIRGGNTKSFYGRKIEATTLDVSANTGIVNYESSELVMTARAGTRLSEIEKTLTEHQQMLGFEPPHFGDTATLGGTIACGFSGPRRASAGSARDFMLGARIINGTGEQLRFGGQVMKNVAGYDVSRLMTGALGTLGVLTELSLKVIPVPEVEQSLCFELSEHDALLQLQQWLANNLPITASSYYQDKLCIRLSGSSSAIEQTLKSLGGEELSNAGDHWLSLREQQHDFFQTDKPLWRISLAPASPAFTTQENCLLEWGGGQRWVRGEIDHIKSLITDGYITLFRNNINNNPFQKLPASMLSLQRRIKQAVDPTGILNPGKMYQDL